MARALRPGLVNLFIENGKEHYQGPSGRPAIRNSSINSSYARVSGARGIEWDWKSGTRSK